MCCALVGCAGVEIPEAAAAAEPQVDIKSMTRAELDDNFYAYMNFERFISDEIPYGRSYKYIGEDWTEKALKTELDTILNQRDTLPKGATSKRSPTRIFSLRTRTRETPRASRRLR